MKIKFKKLLVPVLLTSVIVTSINFNSSRVQAKDVSSVVNKFNWSYYKTIKDTSENHFYSPYSISEVLAIAINGGNKTLKSTVLKKLGVSKLPTLNKYFRDFDQVVSKLYKSGRLFKNSNLIMYDRNSGGLNKSYKGIVKSNYNATVKAWDIAEDVLGAKKYIKNYVSKATNRFIPDYESIIESTDVVDLLNAVYFKGDWEEEFNASNTRKSDFTCSNSNEVSVDMMANTSDVYGYFENSKFKGVSLPYKLKSGNSVVSMYAVIPSDESSVNIQKLWSKESYKNKEKFLKSIKTNSNREVTVYLPKFEVDVKYNLSSFFKDYTGNGIYNKILNKKNLEISQVNHQAKVKVNELGTEAAAITEATMKLTSVFEEKERVTIKLDRPFVFVIRDEKTGTELFTGVINTLK